MRVEVLGPVRVVGGDGEARLGGPQRRLVLALLVAVRGRVLTSDQLVDRIWGDDLPAGPHKSVQVHVSRLRKVLGPEAIVTEGDGYRLADDTDTDLIELERLVGDARTLLPDRPHRAAAVLRRGEELWRGPPFADLRDEEGLRGVIARLEELRLTALADRIEADIAAGAAAATVSELEALIEQHPHRERLRGLHMTALYRSGRQTEALRAYQGLRADLGDGVGIEPSPELRQLEQRILEHDPSLTVESPPSSGNLPAEVDAFVGRSEELAEIEALLVASRLVTITGAGGAGKTRLALQVARTRAGAAAAILSLPELTYTRELRSRVALGTATRCCRLPTPSPSCSSSKATPGPPERC